MVETRNRLPYSRAKIRAAEISVASAPKGTAGYPLDSSLFDLSAMEEANQVYRASRNPRQRVER